MSETVNSSPAASFAIHRRSSATAWQCLWGGSPSGRRMASERASCSFASAEAPCGRGVRGRACRRVCRSFCASYLLLYTICAKVKSAFLPAAAAWTALFGEKSVREGCAMGKTIDRAALHVLAALGLYLCFVSALGHIWLAAGCALARCCFCASCSCRWRGGCRSGRRRRGAPARRWSAGRCWTQARRRRRRARCWKRPIRGRRRRRTLCFCRATRRGRPWTSTPCWTSGAGGAGKSCCSSPRRGPTRRRFPARRSSPIPPCA